MWGSAFENQHSSALLPRRKGGAEAGIARADYHDVIYPLCHPNLYLYETRSPNVAERLVGTMVVQDTRRWPGGAHQGRDDSANRKCCRHHSQ
jgi:hypothetical protein